MLQHKCRQSSGKSVPRIDPCGAIGFIPDRRGSEKACCSQSEILLYHQHLSRPDIPMPRVWKSAAAPNWTDYPPPHPQPNMTSSSSSKQLWSSSETMDEQHVTGVWDFEHYSVGRSTKKAYVNDNCHPICSYVVCQRGSIDYNRFVTGVRGCIYNEFASTVLAMALPLSIMHHYVLSYIVSYS